MTAFAGRCPLCGARTKRAYCWAHSWAGYDNTKRGAPVLESERAPVTPKKPAVLQPLTLVAGASTGSGRRLVARRPA